MWRPRFHVTGARNWINDPNGALYRDGVHHLFFQANPDGPFWGAPRWAHVTSTDLVTWGREPDALVPSPGTADADGCWSGCVRIVGGRPAAYYTGVVGEDDARRVESVCRAWGSEDLRGWTKDPGNPLIRGPSSAGPHRDPFLWRDAGGWHLLVAAGAQILRYDAPDATAWQDGGEFFSASDVDLGAPWECPQLVFDGDAAALVVSGQDAAGGPRVYAFAGVVRDGRFEGALDGRLDWGDVFYAPAVSEGGELLWGWAQERLDLERQGALSHAGALTLPRRTALEGGRLVTRPAAELTGLRAEPLPPGSACPQMELALRGLGAWTLTAGPAEVVARLDGDSVRMTVADGEVRRFAAPLPARAEHALRVFVDGSLIEAVADDGDAWITTRAYPPAGGWDSATATGDAAAWRLRDDVIAAA